MFAKFFGYEFKETAKMPVLFYIAAIVISLNMGFCVNATMKVHGDIPIYTGISTILMVGAVVAVTIGTFSVLIKRYRATMFEDQAYLTHTLPIKRDVIVLAKLLNSVIWSIFSCIVTAICMITISLLTASEEIYIYIQLFFRNYEMFNERFMSVMNCGFVTWVLLSLLFVIVSAVFFYMAIYMCMAIGNLASKRKRLLSVGALFGVWIVVQTTINTLANAVDFDSILFTRRTIYSDFGYSTVILDGFNYPALVGLLCAISAIFSVIMYFVNRAIVNKHLNI